MTLLDQEVADVTSLDAGDVFLGGRYHSLLPILHEIYPGKRLEWTSIVHEEYLLIFVSFQATINISILWRSSRKTPYKMFTTCITCETKKLVFLALEVWQAGLFQLKR